MSAFISGRLARCRAQGTCPLGCLQRGIAVLERCSRLMNFLVTNTVNSLNNRPFASLRNHDLLLMERKKLPLHSDGQFVLPSTKEAIPKGAHKPLFHFSGLTLPLSLSHCSLRFTPCNHNEKDDPVRGNFNRRLSWLWTKQNTQGSRVILIAGRPWASWCEILQGLLMQMYAFAKQDEF